MLHRHKAAATATKDPMLYRQTNRSRGTESVFHGGFFEAGFGWLFPYGFTLPASVDREIRLFAAKLALFSLS